MKKITLIVASLLACVGVMAQEQEVKQITSLADSKSNESYVFYTKDAGLYAKADGSAITANRPSAGYDKTADASKFAFINQDGKYYIWSVSAEKFLTIDGSLKETGTPDPVEFVVAKDAGYEGRVRMTFGGGKNINITSARNAVIIDGWAFEDEGSAYYVEVASESFDLTKAMEMLNSSVQVTYIYKYNGTEFDRQTVTQDANTAYSAPAKDYMVFTYPDDNTVSATNKEVVVTCTEALPFEASESFEKAKWYVVDMHSNDNGTGDIKNGSKKYIWTYTNGSVQLPKEDSKQSAVFGDEKMWCFVGNVVDGFKIYNKAAGNALAINKATDGNNEAKMDAAATLFTLHKGQIENSTCFKPVGHTYYLNTQAVNGVKILKGWTDNDGGSSCRFFAPTALVKDLLANYLVPEAVVGSPIDWAMWEEKVAVISSAYDAISADAWNVEAVTPAIAEAVAAFDQAEKFELAAGDYYIAGTGVGNKANWGLTVNAGGKIVAAEVSGDDLSAFVWTLEAVEDGYTLKSQGKYAGALTAAAGETAMVDEGVKYTFTDAGLGKFIIKDKENHVMRTENNGVINFWGTESNEAWYLIPVSYPEVYDLSEVVVGDWVTDDETIVNPDLSSLEASWGGFIWNATNNTSYDAENGVMEFVAGENTSASLVQEEVPFAGTYRLTGKAYHKGAVNAVMFVGDKTVEIPAAEELTEISIEFEVEGTNYGGWTAPEYLNVGYSCEFDNAEDVLVVGGFKLETKASMTLQNKFYELAQNLEMVKYEVESKFAALYEANKATLEAAHAPALEIFGALQEGKKVLKSAVKASVEAMEVELAADYVAVVNYYSGTFSSVLQKAENKLWSLEGTEGYNVLSAAIPAEDAVAAVTEVAELEEMVAAMVAAMEAASQYIPTEVVLKHAAVIEIKVGDTFQLAAEVLPSTASQVVSYYSGDWREQYITVTEDGLVTALAEGEVTITIESAADAWVYTECTVKVVGLTDDIENIEAETETVIYDLSGRRVEKMEKGIYIVNGKKVIK